MRKYAESLYSLNAAEIVAAAKKEASREVGEMIRWRDHQLKHDPDGMLWEYQEMFPLVVKAVRYRSKIYNRNREIEQVKYDIMVAENEQDSEALEHLMTRWGDLEAEQMALVWRIQKIYCHVRAHVIIAVGEGVDEVFKEFEYDLEKS